MTSDVTERAATPLGEMIDRLARFEPTGDPVISLYLNLQADQHGRDNFDVFLRKETKDRLKTYTSSPARTSLEADIERVRRYLATELDRSANGLAIFACQGELLEALQLDAPFDEHRLFIDQYPHVYPLARLDNRFPRYAALLADTNSARLFVFSTGRLLEEQQVLNLKTRGTSMGGWSQARYQRHIENYHLHHAKEVVEKLDELVRRENIPAVVIAGEETVIPLIRAELAPHLESKVIDVLRLETKTPQHEVLAATLEALRQHDANDDRGRVERAIGAYQAGGLGVVGREPTLTALDNGQVDELLVTATAGEDDGAEELVRKARQTSAKVTFIENPELLAGVGGVAALLRYRI